MSKPTREKELVNAPSFISTLTHVKKCIHSCPFFGTSMDGMECNHPSNYHRPSMQRVVITHSNGLTDVPPRCPLRKHSVTQTVVLSV